MRVRGQDAAVSAETWVDEVTAQVRERLREHSAAWESQGLTAPPAEEILAGLARLLPSTTPSALDEHLGPFYDTAGAAARLGHISKQAVDSRRRQHTVLAMKTADNRWVYPTFQFDGTDVDRRLVPAFRALSGAPEWSAGLWFVTPNPDLDDKTPLEWAREDLPAAALLLSAQRTAREWGAIPAAEGAAQGAASGAVRKVVVTRDESERVVSMKSAARYPSKAVGASAGKVAGRRKRKAAKSAASGRIVTSKGLKGYGGHAQSESPVSGKK